MEAEVGRAARTVMGGRDMARRRAAEFRVASGRVLSCFDLLNTQILA